MPRDALIVYGTNVVTDDALGRAIPVVPAGGDVAYEDDGWCTWWPQGRDARPNLFAHCWLAVRDAPPNQARGCWVVIGPAALIDALKPRVTRWWETLAALRADNGAIATGIKNAWRDDRRAGDASPIVGLRHRMAGFLDDDAENAR